MSVGLLNGSDEPSPVTWNPHSNSRFRIYGTRKRLRCHHPFVEHNQLVLYRTVLPLPFRDDKRRRKVHPHPHCIRGSCRVHGVVDCRGLLKPVNKPSLEVTSGLRTEEKVIEVVYRYTADKIVEVFGL